MTGKTFLYTLAAACMLGAVQADGQNEEYWKTTSKPWKPTKHHSPSPWKTTTTIPWTGHSTTCTTIVPCPGTSTIVTLTPLWTPTSCPGSPTPTWTSSTTTPTPPTTTPTTSSKTTTSSSSTTTSSTPTPSPTDGSCLNFNPLCAADGLDISYYSAPFYAAVAPGYYLTEPVLAHSTTSDVYLADNPGQPPAGEFQVIYPNPTSPTIPYYVGWTRTVDGGIVVNANNFTLVYQGFYRAPETGNYSICGIADNAGWFWFGDNSAFSCLTGQANQTVQPLASFPIFSVSCVTVALTEGRHYPFRFQETQINGESKLNVTINLPGSVGNDPNAHTFTGDVFRSNCGIYL